MTTTGDALTARPIEVGDDALADLRDRLGRTRWPEPATVDDWSQGVPLDYLRETCAYWAEGYDWRRVESELNGYHQLAFRPSVAPDDPVDIQVLHAPSPMAGATPLVLTHGWPGSVVEFLDVIEALRDPEAHGGDAGDAFHVVCPTLPGYGFSGRPARTGWNVERIADAWAELMTALGYERFGAQGGDWGSMVTTEIGVRHPDRCVGIHLNMVSIGPGRNRDDLTEREQAALASLEDYDLWDSGYSTQQATRPQTLGYGLVDSPAGQAAWVLEKFWRWVDHPGLPDQVVPRDRLLDNVMHYWLPGTGASSARLYWESYRVRRRAPVTVPTGVSVFPKEIFRPSRRWVERRFEDVRHWSELDEGGHFAALEQPETFVDEVRTAFRTMR